VRPMRTIWQALAWKEWHEHKWKLAAITTILLSVSAAVLFDSGETMFAASFVMLVYGIIPISMFMGAADAAGESTRGTLQFTQSLPVSMRRVGFWKFALGLGTCALPILFTIGSIVIWYLLRGQYDDEVTRGLRQFIKGLYKGLYWPLGIDYKIRIWILNASTVSLTVAASLYIWTLAWGVNRRTEVRAGATALLVGLILWTFLIVVGQLVGSSISIDALDRLLALAASVLPGGFPISMLISLQGPRSSNTVAFFAVGMAAVFHLGLIGWAICRYGAPEASEPRSKTAASDAARREYWLPSPTRSPFRAILWKQWRESGPIVLLGVVAIFVVVMGNFLLYYNMSAVKNWPDLGELLISIAFPIGFLLSMIVGINSFDQDMSPKINEFWRSRPIQVDLWFWTKFLTGMAILAAALYLPIVIAYVIANGVGAGQRPFFVRGETLMMLCFHLAIYAAATATIVIIRQPIYAAILGVGALLIGVAFVSAIWGIEAIQIESIIYTIEFTTAILATLVAWFAIRFDWGRTR
jgi:ABC-type transport system involved in multi-copper enzyme maturation permease subunit